MKVIKIVCPQCWKIHQDVPAVFKKDPRVEIEIVYRVCQPFCDGRLAILRQMGRRLQNKLNKKGGAT